MITADTITQAQPHDIIASTRLGDLMAVALIGTVGDWACYVISIEASYPGGMWDHLSKVERFIASKGYKATSAQAFILFPCDEQAKSRYRR